MAAGLLVWAVVRLLGVDLTVEPGSDTTQVDVVDVLLATLADGISAVCLICMHIVVGVVPDHGVHAPGAEPVRHRRRDRRPAVARG